MMETVAIVISIIVVVPIFLSLLAMFIVGFIKKDKKMADQAEGLRSFVEQVGRADGPYRDDLGNIVLDVEPSSVETALDYFAKIGKKNV